MKVSIKIEFNSPKDAHTALALIAGLDCPAAFETEAAPVVSETAPETAAATEAPKTAKPKSPGRPKKTAEKTHDETEAVKEAEEKQIHEEAKAEEKSVISASEIRKEIAEKAAITIDDARSKLKTYALAHGTDAALQVLALYGAKKISDLPAEKYGEFVAKLEANT